MCVKGCVMTAYFKDEVNTAKTLDKDGFVHTGLKIKEKILI